MIKFELYNICIPNGRKWKENNLIFTLGLHNIPRVQPRTTETRLNLIKTDAFFKKNITVILSKYRYYIQKNSSKKILIF